MIYFSKIIDNTDGYLHSSISTRYPNAGYHIKIYMMTMCEGGISTIFNRLRRFHSSLVQTNPQQLVVTNG